jgi:mannitol operon repressor
LSEVPFWVEAYAKGRDEIWEKDPYYKGFLAALGELKGETDRGVALVTTSFLDKLLGDTLKAFTIDNESSKRLFEGFNAPFGTLSTRITGCHALGLINDAEAGQCNILRRVRNEFAHQVEVSFKSDRVNDLCNNLEVSNRDKDGDARRKFMGGSMSLLVMLLNRPHEVAQTRLVPGKWNTAL